MTRTIREFVSFPITLREATVVRIEDITPGMRRLVIAGPQLRAFTRLGHPQEAVRSEGFDDHVKLVFPRADGSAPEMPGQVPGTLSWTREAIERSRNYTVRSWDEASAEMTIDVVRHVGGLAAEWSFGCAVGDRLWFAGPKESALWPHGVDWYLVAGDETALPAIARWVEEAPPGTRAQIFVELTDRAHRQDLALQEGMEVTWLGPVTERPSPLLADAVMAAEVWPGTVYAFVAGEALGIKPLRRHLRREWGLPRERVEVVGYWRHQPTQEPATALEEEAHRIEHMADLLVPVITRAAVTAGLVRRLVAGPATAEVLATELGLREDPVARLLRAMVATELAEPVEGGFALTRLGAELDSEDLRQQLDLADPGARDVWSIIDLLPALGVILPERSETTSLLGRHALHADQAKYVASDVEKLSLVRAAGHVTLRGTGTSTLADHLLSSRPDLRMTIVARPHEREWILSDVSRLGHVPDASRRIAFVGPDEPLPETDVSVLAWESGGRDDAGLRGVVGSAARAGRTVVLLDTLLGEEVHDHDAAADLAELTARGRGMRTTAELETLLTEVAAGHDLSVRQDITPWVGLTSYTLTAT